MTGRPNFPFGKDGYPERTDSAYWERAIPGESLEWFSRFREYFEAGDGRTKYGVYVNWRKRNPVSQKQTKKAKSAKVHEVVEELPGNWRQWCTEFAWDDRVLAAKEWEIQESKKGLPLYREQMKLNERKLAEIAFQKAAELFNFPVQEVIQEEETGNLIIKPINGRNLDSAIALFKVASEGWRKGADAAEVDALTAIQTLANLGVLPKESMEAASGAYDQFQDMLRTSIKSSLDRRD
jgi:hypothetical protein